MFQKAIDIVSLAAVSLALALAIAGMANLFQYLDFVDCVDSINAITDDGIAQQVYQCRDITGMDNETVARFLP